MNGHWFPNATTLRLCFALGILFVVVESVHANPSEAYRLPQFRHVAEQEGAAPLSAGTRLRLLADEDFPPFSFRSAAGGAAGLAVDLGLSACSEMKVSCSVDLRPLDQLLPALARGDGDVLLDGPLITAAALGEARLTRPWFRSLGRFAAQSGNPLQDASATRLSGKRIAVQKNSAHAAWLAKYYAESNIVAFDTLVAAQEALRTGAVDALFGDDLRLIYWVTGTASRGCCKLVDGAFTDYGTFSRNYSLVIGGDRDAVRQAFDAALDHLQGSGVTEKLFNAYVPLNPW